MKYIIHLLLLVSFLIVWYYVACPTHDKELYPKKYGRRRGFCLTPLYITVPVLIMFYAYMILKKK